MVQTMPGRVARSLLFVPGHQPERFDKACRSGADAVVLDLEDAVPPDAKDAARGMVGHWLAAQALGADAAARPQIAVRVNAADTAWHAQEMAMCRAGGLRRLRLPKVQHPVVLRAAASALGEQARLWPLIETARGMHGVEEIAAAPQVERLVFGTIDFQADLNIETGDDALEDDGEDRALLYFRSRMVLASRLAGLQAPVDGVTTAIGDCERIEADARQARRLGFGGKLCIHPRQVESVNKGFMPSPARVAWARRVIEADAASGGAPVAVDGKMVDRPVVLRARAVLAAAGA